MNKLYVTVEIIFPANHLADTDKTEHTM